METKVAVHVCQQFPGCTSLKTNREADPSKWRFITLHKLTYYLKMGLPKRKRVFQPSMFRCYVSFRGCYRKDHIPFISGCLALRFRHYYTPTKTKYNTWKHAFFPQEHILSNHFLGAWLHSLKFNNFASLFWDPVTFSKPNSLVLRRVPRCWLVHPLETNSFVPETVTEQGPISGGGVSIWVIASCNPLEQN